MDLSAINDIDRAEHFDRVFITMLGGDTVYRMLVDHYNGKNWCEIAELHGVPRSTARGWVKSAKMKLREAGLIAAEPHRTTLRGVEIGTPGFQNRPSGGSF